jgi:RNA polymerase sigma-70 factor (ECF subfamily)
VAEEDASKQSECSLFDLTGRMREGDDEAWHEFHRRYYVALLRYAASRTACPDDAPEIIQQAYLRIARHIKPFANETDFLCWLTCVIRCVAMDHRRGIVRRAVLLEKFALWREVRGSAAEFPGAPSADSIAHDALMKLPSEDAQLLRLKYYEGWSVNQIAADASTTPKAIENRLARLRQRLREIILRIQ